MHFLNPESYISNINLHCSHNIQKVELIPTMILIFVYLMTNPQCTVIINVQCTLTV